MKERYKITYFMDNKLGGVTSLNYNLMQHAPEGIRQEVILIDNASDKAARPSIRFPVDQETLFHFDMKGNFHHNLKRLHKVLGEKGGVLVVNYGTEMAMLDHYIVPHTVYQLVHDDYNLGLAVEFGYVVDVFISHNKDMYQKLLSAFPDRSIDIHYLPHGVPVPEVCRKRAGESIPLKLLFLGRFSRGKGIYDLPKIASLLRKKGVHADWTCIGAGPEEAEFRKAWDGLDNVTFISPSSNEEVLAICAAHDVFVLPTKFEGSPVSLLETMSVGLVPVISDLPGGIRETVSSEIGFRIAVNDNSAFADAIESLYKDRISLEKMSLSCRQKIKNDFNIIQTSKKYFSLFGRYEELRKPKAIKKRRMGSRLDHPLIPNSVTRWLRSISR